MTPSNNTKHFAGAQITTRQCHVATFSTIFLQKKTLSMAHVVHQQNCLGWRSGMIMSRFFRSDTSTPMHPMLQDNRSGFSQGCPTWMWNCRQLPVCVQLVRNVRSGSWAQMDMCVCSLGSAFDLVDLSYVRKCVCWLGIYVHILQRN